MKIHTYTSAEPILHVNAFLIETPKGIIVIDTTLTMSDSRALKSTIDSLGRPVLGMKLTPTLRNQYPVGQVGSIVVDANDYIRVNPNIIQNPGWQ